MNRRESRLSLKSVFLLIWRTHELAWRKIILSSFQPIFFAKVCKGSFQKLLSRFFPLSFFGHNDFSLRGVGEYPPIPLRKNPLKNSYFWPKSAYFSPFWPIFLGKLVGHETETTDTPAGTPAPTPPPRPIKPEEHYLRRQLSQSQRAQRRITDDLSLLMAEGDKFWSLWPPAANIMTMTKLSSIHTGCPRKNALSECYRASSGHKPSVVIMIEISECARGSVRPFLSRGRSVAFWKCFFSGTPCNIALLWLIKRDLQWQILLRLRHLQLHDWQLFCWLILNACKGKYGYCQLYMWRNYN